MGAWMAARQERTRFKRMYGYGSNGCFRNKEEFVATHSASTQKKITMNGQLPPKSATLSDTYCPSLRSLPNVRFKFSASVSCSCMLVTTSRSRRESSPFSSSKALSTYCERKSWRHSWQSRLDDVTADHVF